MIVSISQPAYLPWLGYFNRIANSELAIVLDNVMLERSSKTRYTNRNKILTSSGPIWLTVPVVKAGAGQPLINEAKIDHVQNWQEKHKRTIAYSYTKAPFLQQHISWIEDLYSRSWSHLAPLLNESTSSLLRELGIKTPLLFSSQMHVQGSKSELILNLCCSVGATTYLSGPFGRDYIDIDSFSEKGIRVVFDDYVHPTYPQQSNGFYSHMSVLDLLFNCGTSSMDVLYSKIEGIG